VTTIDMTHTPPSEDRIAAAARMPILGHLRELRRRLAISLAVITIGTVVGYFLYEPILAILERPFCAVDPAYRFGGTAERCVLVFSGVLDGFTTRLKIAALAGTVLTAPLWLYQLWAFITPGLKKTERRYTIAFVLSSTVLFATGAFVAYEVLAKGLSMLLSQGGGDVQAMLTVTSYLSFVTLTLVVFGLSFELPLLIVIANLAGVLPAATLRKSQRIAIFLIFVFAGIVVPSTDPFSMCAMAIPMVLLYEAAVGIATLHDHRQARRLTQQAVTDYDDGIALPVDQAESIPTAR
jgi:sec-independent protein translocase protein TatC